MANSRRRERELARRRFERRRQQELERRARAKRRNTVMGSIAGVAAVIAIIVVVAIVVFGGSSSKKPAASVSPGATPTPTASPTPAPKAPKKCATIKPDPPKKGQPDVPQVTGKVSKHLVIKDITVGTGRAAKKGDTVDVDYIGASCSTGKIFDASYLHPPVKPLPVAPLGQANVIQGFNKGLIGIQPGGVRELVIPAKLGYGTTGTTGIAPNDTLIFLVTAKSVTKPAPTSTATPTPTTSPS